MSEKESMTYFSDIIIGTLPLSHFVSSYIIPAPATKKPESYNMVRRMESQFFAEKNVKFVWNDS